MCIVYICHYVLFPYVTFIAIRGCLERYSQLQINNDFISNNNVSVKTKWTRFDFVFKRNYIDINKIHDNINVTIISRCHR